MRFEKIWVEQCRATRAIAGYVAMQKPTTRRQLRALLYFA